MSINNFIPTVWANELLVNLRKAQVAAQPGIINRDYEGQIAAFGDTVQIQNIGAITIKGYTKNTDMSAPDDLSDDTRTLTIDQADYFSFQVDDIDRAQQTPKVMAAAMAEAAYGLSDSADQFILGLSSETDGDNVLDPATPTADDAYEFLVDLGVLLDEANVPAQGRFGIVPSWYHGLLLKDDRFVRAGTPTSDTVLRAGFIGEAAGFQLYKSNNLPRSGSDELTYSVITGHPMAWSFAEQIVSTEALRLQLRFADSVRGLHLYGAKVVRPTALAVFPALRAS